MSWQAKRYMGRAGEFEDFLPLDGSSLTGRQEGQLVAASAAARELLKGLDPDQYVSLTASGHADNEPSPRDAINVYVTGTHEPTEAQKDMDAAEAKRRGDAAKLAEREG